MLVNVVKVAITHHQNVTLNNKEYSFLLDCGQAKILP
jgi:hypothetical protein